MDDLYKLTIVDGLPVESAGKTLRYRLVHLRETTMDKKTRTLLQVSVRQDRAETTAAVDRLMGTKPEARFDFIQENAAFVTDLDI